MGLNLLRFLDWRGILKIGGAISFVTHRSRRPVGNKGSWSWFVSRSETHFLNRSDSLLCGRQTECIHSLAQQGNGRVTKVGLFRFQSDLQFGEQLKDRPQVLKMFLGGAREDENIIYVTPCEMAVAERSYPPKAPPQSRVQPSRPPRL